MTGALGADASAEVERPHAASEGPGDAAESVAESAAEMAAGRPMAAGRLAELAVHDLAVIERLRISFEPGLNVLTGETGAGKSLLIDALGLAVGARADTSLVRHGSDSARVEALFDRLPEPLICVREVSGAGRSTARIDDESVTAARLAAVAGRLVEIHGQHDQQRLLDERWQRELLDAFGVLGAERAATAAAVGAWRANQAALAELTLDPRELARRLELQQHQLAEIAGARLRPGEASEIRGRLSSAQHAESIARGSAEIHELLAGEGSGARETTAEAARRARDLAKLDERYEPVAERLLGLAAELEDAAAEAATLAESVEHDPSALARMEERLSLIYSLERKYGEDEAAVIAYGERAAAESERLRSLEASRESRQAEAARLLEVVASTAVALSGGRQGAAHLLAKAVEGALAGLGFQHTSFQVVVSRRSAGASEPAVEIEGERVAFDGSGIDTVVFLIAPNPGEPARPLARIASGGELSRVALAIKQILAEADNTPTLVFDEIDSGIGGRSAEPVGRSLWELARSHQVLCVTHLGQIAAYADAQFRIEKRQREGRTVTEVHRLTEEERVEEVAAMLAGAEGGAGARAGAEELLQRADAWRRSAGGR
ncbi:MAG: DNA repair protein RecN [Candidatus Limnocylindrales bacterium]|jgi:DNA repair protein RecN (Recombination protein N)